MACVRVIRAPESYTRTGISIAQRSQRPQRGIGVGAKLLAGTLACSRPEMDGVFTGLDCS
jgi:hypothetical protein